MMKNLLVNSLLQSKKVYLLLLFALFILTGLSMRAYANEEEVFATECHDYLKQVASAPDYFEFIECHQDTERQAKPFIATYHIKGKFMAEAEAFLTARFKLEKMSYICCGWEMKSDYYIDPKTHIDYLIGTGVETVYSARKDWDKISCPYHNEGYVPPNQWEL